MKKATKKAEPTFDLEITVKRCWNDRGQSMWVWTRKDAAGTRDGLIGYYTAEDALEAASADKK